MCGCGHSGRRLKSRRPPSRGHRPKRLTDLQQERGDGASAQGPGFRLGSGVISPYAAPATAANVDRPMSPLLFCSERGSCREPNRRNPALLYLPSTSWDAVSGLDLESNRRCQQHRIRLAQPTLPTSGFSRFKKPPICRGLRPDSRVFSQPSTVPSRKRGEPRQLPPRGLVSVCMPSRGPGITAGCLMPSARQK